MKLHTFSQANLEAQIETIQTNGRLLAHQVKGVYAINLYQLHDYYVETYFHLLTLSFQWVNCFDSTAKELLPYLKKIKLPAPLLIYSCSMLCL